MKFASTLIGLVGSAALASAASVTFWTLDDLERTIYFESNNGAQPMPPVKVSNKEKKRVDFADNFVGNYHAVIEGQSDTGNGMLGEVQFGGWMGKTYYDVSGIVNMTDTNNVKQMWPADALGPVSGCIVFPCDRYYVLSDDKQTRVTDSVDLMQTLGHGDPGIKFDMSL